MKFKKVILGSVCLLISVFVVVETFNVVFRCYMKENFPLKDEITYFVESCNWENLQKNYVLLSELGYTQVDETEEDVSFTTAENEGKHVDPSPFISIAKHENTAWLLDDDYSNILIDYKVWWLPLVEYYGYFAQQNKVVINMVSTTPEAIVKELERIADISHNEATELP